MEKQIAQEIFDELVKAIREKRAFLIVDSKSHGYTCYFQICSINERGIGFTYDNILIEAKKKGLEVPEDFDALIQNIPSF